MMSDKEPGQRAVAKDHEVGLFATAGAEVVCISNDE